MPITTPTPKYKHKQSKVETTRGQACNSARPRVQFSETVTMKRMAPVESIVSCPAGTTESQTASKRKRISVNTKDHMKKLEE
jgi:hypothetical protein